ncbi:MAG TPA: 50S ribosomal protein L10 [Gaiellaceae bacterium]|nr:50S ribosomal protein L10 [Gaiellaceae bacterium]
MQKSEKERVVAELTERLRTSETLIVADYRGLTNAEIDGLRSKLIEHGARFAVVKNTLTRRAAEAAGAEALLALLDGPSAIAFVESDGDPAAVAKALRDAATSTKILAIRGGVLEGVAMSADEVESLAKLPPADVLRAQLVGAIVSPLTTIVALMAAPLRDLAGLIDARIEQLTEQGDTSAAEAAPTAEPEPEPEPEPATEEPSAAEPAAEAEPSVSETQGDAGDAAEAVADGGDAQPVVEDTAEETAAETTDTETQEEQK